MRPSWSSWVSCRSGSELVSPGSRHANNPFLFVSSLGASFLTLPLFPSKRIRYDISLDELTHRLPFLLIFPLPLFRIFVILNALYFSSPQVLDKFHQTVALAFVQKVFQFGLLGSAYSDTLHVYQIPTPFPLLSTTITTPPFPTIIGRVSMIHFSLISLTLFHDSTCRYPFIVGLQLACFPPCHITSCTKDHLSPSFSPSSHTRYGTRGPNTTTIPHMSYADNQHLLSSLADT